MRENESVEYFKRMLNERFAEFKAALDELISVLPQGDIKKKMQVAGKVVGSLTSLKNAMSKRDRPAWIGELYPVLDEYRRMGMQHKNLGLGVLRAIMKCDPAIRSQKWDFINPSLGFDFDAVYQECYRESKMPDIFDNLVLQLETIIEGGHVDSRRAINALKRLIATIKKNARGGFFSTYFTWDFTRALIKNAVFEALDSIPVLKQVVGAVRTTVSELDSEMSQVNGRICTRLAELTNAELPMLEYHPLALPSPQNESADDGN